MSVKYVPRAWGQKTSLVENLCKGDASYARKDLTENRCTWCCTGDPHRTSGLLRRGPVVWCWAFQPAARGDFVPQEKVFFSQSLVLDQGLMGPNGRNVPGRTRQALERDPYPHPCHQEGVSHYSAPSWPGPLRRRGPIPRPARPLVPYSPLSQPTGAAPLPRGMKRWRQVQLCPQTLGIPPPSPLNNRDQMAVALHRGPGPALSAFWRRLLFNLHKTPGLRSAIHSTSVYWEPTHARLLPEDLGCSSRQNRIPPLGTLAEGEPRKCSHHPISQMRKLRLRGVRELAQGHTACEPTQRIWDNRVGSMDLAESREKMQTEGPSLQFYLETSWEFHPLFHKHTHLRLL